MEPAKPPLPTPRYLPFHPLAGSHTSNSMCESADGVRTPCTRQNSGVVLKMAAFGPEGGVKAPAATTCAEVADATFWAKVSQSAAAATPAHAARTNKVRRFTLTAYRKLT